MWINREISSSPDPYIMTEYTAGLMNKTGVGKSLRSQTTDPTKKTLVLIISGQSNVANSAPTNYSPTNSTVVDNINPYDGAIYSGSDPMIGCDSGVATGGGPAGGNFAGRLADKLIDAGKFDRVILAPVSIDGTTVAQWQSSLYQRIIVVQNRLAYRGINSSTTGVTIVKLWGQGESDHGTAQATYQTALQSVIDATATSGFVVPWFIAEQTWLGGATDTNIQNAQLAIVNHSGNVWAGPNADSLNATYRNTDNTHFIDTGMDAYADLWKTALNAYGPPF